MTSGFGFRNLRNRGRVFTALAGFVLIWGTGLSDATAQQAQPPQGEHREMELQRYRDSVRRHFVLKQYEELLELTEKYGHLYPEDQGTEFYRTQAEIRLEEAEKKIPFARLEDRDFEIPGADEGRPSLLDELREGQWMSEADGGASMSGGDPGSKNQIAMGTGPTDGRLPLPLEAPTPLDSMSDSGTGDVDLLPPRAGTRPPAEEGAGRRESSLPPSPEVAAGVSETASEDGGSSPLPLILGGSVLVLGAVAAFLLIGLARRGKEKNAAEIAESAFVEGPVSPPAPPLFNFDDSEAPESGGSEFDSFESPDPFAESAMPEEAGLGATGGAGESSPASSHFENESESDLGSGPALEGASAQALGETRGAEVNQEISDLLFAPESGSIDESAMGPGMSSSAEPPPPLGETRADASSAEEEISDLVQIPDDDALNLDPFSDAGVDSMFAEASQPQQTPDSGVIDLDAPSSSADLSSIDLFGDQSSGDGGGSEADATSNVSLDEIDASISESGGSQPEELEEAGASEPDGIEIPFAMEDPFQNLGDATEEPAATSPSDEETAFNTSTAETFTGQGSDTGVDERELLEVIEDGEGGGGGWNDAGEAPTVAPPGGDDIWSGLETGSGHSEPVQTFKEDESAIVEFDDVEAGQPPTSAPEPKISSPEAETVVPSAGDDTGSGNLPDDPFEREHQRGRQAVDAGDWTKAVYHLSIAASLKPESTDVREELREARKMKKEQQTG